MPVRMNIVTVGKYKHIRILRSYKNENGDPRSQLVKSFGRLDEALARDPDILDKAQKFVADWNERELTEKHRLRMEHAESLIKNMSQDPPSKEGKAVYNIGVAILYKIAKDLKIPAIFDYIKGKCQMKYDLTAYVLLLIFLRVLKPASKMASWADRNTTIRDFSSASQLHVCYRCLGKLSTFKNYIIRALNRQINKIYDRGLTVAFYDVTTFAFESQQADTIREFGMSKDKKFNEVQVVLGLLMDQYGIPIDYELYPGNTSEFGTLIPVIENYKKTYKVNKITVVADRGLNSNENLFKLKKIGCDFIMAHKIKNCEKELEGKIFSDDWTTLKRDENNNIIYKSKVIEMSKKLYKTKTGKNGKRYHVGSPIDSLDINLHVSWSLSRKNKDLRDQERSWKKADNAITKGTAKPGKKGFYQYISFEQEAEGNASLDIEKFESQKKWHGLYAICTNNKELSPDMVENIYHSLWKIEDCFRVSKSMLEFRPCYVWKPEHVKGHFLLCYLALTIERILANKVKLAAQQGALKYITPEAILKSLRSAGVVIIGDNAPCYLKVNTDSNFDPLCEACGLQPLNTYESKQGICAKLRMRSVI